jgi:N-acetylmuramoyl-L-alanine amidase
VRAAAAALAVLLATGTLAAQTPLVIELDGRRETLAAAMQRGVPAHPATALRLLGATLLETPAGFRVILFGDTLVFEALSPYFLAAERPVQLAGPVYRDGGVLYLPQQFFSEWLPARYPERLHFAAGTLHAAGSTTRRPPPHVAGDSAARTAAAPNASQPRRGSRTVDSTRVVVLDPGHGGRDPGKAGPGGVLEKDIALAVSHRLATMLRQRGYEVHMTRTTDTLIPLADRPRLANQWKAGRPQALFMSIHANAATRASAAGFETFFLSEARTEDERRVAELENAAVQYEEASADPVDLDDLSYILSGLRNNFYLRASNDFAEVVQERLAAFHPGPNRGVKQAGFRVLVGALMPAVLVELAFITNAAEARLLASATFQRQAAFALAEAVDRFFEGHAFLWADDEADE